MHFLAHPLDTVYNWSYTRLKEQEVLNERTNTTHQGDSPRSVIEEAGLAWRPEEGTFPPEPVSIADFMEADEGLTDEDYANFELLDEHEISEEHPADLHEPVAHVGGLGGRPGRWRPFPPTRCTSRRTWRSVS